MSIVSADIAYWRRTVQLFRGPIVVTYRDRAGHEHIWCGHRDRLIELPALLEDDWARLQAVEEGREHRTEES